MGSKLVVKLWYNPVPNPVKNMVEELCSVLAIPTKVPVDPKPTLTVYIPIKLLLILAAKTTVPSSKVLMWVPVSVSNITDNPAPTLVL